MVKKKKIKYFNRFGKEVGTREPIGDDVVSGSDKLAVSKKEKRSKWFSLRMRRKEGLPSTLQTSLSDTFRRVVEEQSEDAFELLEELEEGE